MTNSQRVFEIIAENPGINGGDIRRKLNSEGNREFTIRNINMILNGLKRRSKDAVENRGSTGRTSRWYVVVPEEPEPNPYLSDAQRILRDLRFVSPKKRSLWLAEQIRDVVDR